MTSFVLLFQSLPLEILLVIFRTYLQGKTKFAVLQTTKSLCNLRKQLYIFSLNAIESKKFALNRRYRQKIVEALENPEVQISLIFDSKLLPGGGWGDAFDLSIALPAKSIIIRGFTQLLNLPIILNQRKPLEYLQIANCDSELDMYVLAQGVKALMLENCTQVINLQSTGTDLSLLKSLQLFNTCTDLTSVDIFRSLNELTLSGCIALSDVSCLQTIDQLSLHHCPQVSNVNMLEKCSSLRISHCGGLSEIQFLEMSQKKLYIEKCDQLQSLHLEGFLEQLYVGSCPISSLTVQGSIHKCILTDCFELQALSHVHRVVRLEVECCDSLEAIDCSVESLDLLECPRLGSITSLPLLQELTISGCPGLQRIAELPKLRSLEVDEDCEGLRWLENLPLCQDYLLALSSEILQGIEVRHCPFF